MLRTISALTLVACAARPPAAAPTPTAPVATVTAPTPTAPAAPATPATPAPDARADGRLPDTVRPTRYDLRLRIDPSTARYDGEVRIALRLTAPTASVVLHARDLDIPRAALTVGGRELVAQTSLRRAAGAREASEELVVQLPETVPAGDATLSLTFARAYPTELRGLYRVRAGDDWYAISDFEPTSARRAFPCFDEPGFKVPFAVTVTSPDADKVFSNMPETSAEHDPRGGTTHHFAETPPTPTYLVAFVAGPFDVLEGPTSPVPVRVIAPRGRSALGRLAATTAAAHLEILARYFDMPYPYPKLDLVAVPDFLPGAMENPGLITFRDGALLLDPERAPARSRYYMQSTVAHELAHQWFGDYVTMSWWDDLWLNEGFATWMSTRVMDTWEPALGARIDAVGQLNAARMVDASETARPIRQPVANTSDAMESFDWFTYSKGAAVIGVLETWVGPEAFRDGLRRYVRAHAWGNAAASDLLSAVSAAAGRDVAPVANALLDRPGVPIVDLQWSCPPGRRPRVTLRQSRFHLLGEREPAGRWTLPVCFRYPGPVAQGPARTQCTVISDAETTVDLESPRCPGWIHPNANAQGYYWYRVSPVQLVTMLRDPRALDTAARLDLLADLQALVSSGQLAPGPYLDALQRLATDVDPHVVEEVANTLFSVERTLVEDRARLGFELWVQRVIGPVAQRLGWRTHPGDFDPRKNLRRAALNALGMLTHVHGVHREADALAASFLRDPTSVEGEAAAVALPVASRHARADRLDALVAALPRAATPQDRALLLSSMTTFDDLALVRRAYDLALTDTLRAQDLRALFGRTGPTPAARALPSQWVMEHFDALRARWGGNMRGLLHTAGMLCDDDAERALLASLRPRVADLDGVERALAQSAAWAHACATVRARSARRATEWFNERTPAAARQAAGHR